MVDTKIARLIAPSLEGVWERTPMMETKHARKLDDELFTRRETEDALHISPRTLFDLRASGRLPFVRVGGSICYFRSDIEEFLLRNRVGGSKKKSRRRT